VVGVLLLAGPGAAFWAYHRAGPALPEVTGVDLAGIDPEVAQAITSAQTAVLGKPRSAAAWGHFALVLQAHGFLEEALTCYDVAARLDARNPLWPYLQGNILQHGADPGAALPYLERAAALSPPGSPARLRLADLLLEQGRLEEAAGEFATVLQADPDDAHAQFGMGQLAVARRRYHEALRYLQAVDDNPHARRSACALRAAVCEQLGDTAAMERERRRLAELPKDPPWPDEALDRVLRVQVGFTARREQAKRLVQQGRLDEALPLFQDTVARYPNSELAWIDLAWGLGASKDFAAAERALQKGIELAPGNARCWYYLGAARSEQRRFGQAAEAFRKAIELSPTDAEAHCGLGACLRELGDRAGAADAFRQALRYRPDMDDARKGLAALSGSLPGG
jgi:tetratricopeptide (TPR) repeat protein